MGRILLAWELGSNYGHVAMLLPLARRLRQSAHTVYFSIQDCPAKQLLDAEGFDYVFSPSLPGQGNPPCQPASFADILGEAGFADIEMLTHLARAWHDLFNNLQPSVVVAQYAPVAQFAARLFRLPCLQINTGFESPPEVSPFPCFRPYLKITREQLLAKELPLLENINKISWQHDFAAYSSLPEALKSDLDLLVTLPDLDHYPGRRSGRYIGPMFALDEGLDVQWPEKTGPRILLYLRPMPGLTAILETLSRNNGSVIAFIPGIDNKLSASFTDKGLNISQSLIKLAPILPNTDLVISHAGHGLTAAALLAGVPMLMLPSVVEQWLISRNIQRLGVGLWIKQPRIVNEFPVALQKLQSNHSYREKAKEIARKYARYNQKQMLQRVANTIGALPAWAANKDKINY